MSGEKYTKIVVIFLSLFSYGSCIKCFQCNDVQVPECTDLTVNDTNSRFFLECNGNYGGKKPFCRKVVSLNNAVDNSQRIIRSCGYILNETQWNVDKCRKLDTNFIKTMSCQCFSDGCNTAQSYQIRSYLIVLPIISGFVILLGHFGI